MQRRNGNGGLARRDFLRVAAGASIGLMGAGTLGIPARSLASQGGGTLTFSLGQDIRSSDPHADTMTQAQSVFRHAFETLVTRDEDLNLVPLLATSWKNISPTTWEFKLRDGVKFHNGQPFSAADVKFSLDRMLDKSLNLMIRTFVQTIAGVEVVDPMTVRITTSAPDPIVVSRLGFGGAVILPAESVKKVGPAFFQKPAGTGAFKFSEWVKDDHVNLDANPDYWGGRPKLGKLVYKPILEASTRLAALKTNVVDLVSNVQPQQIAEIQSDQNLQIARVRSARTLFVVLNTLRKPFDDVRVRQAMNYAVDVDTIIKYLMGGNAYRVPSVTGPAYFGYDPDQKPYSYDPEKAKALLSQAGYPNGFEVTFNTCKGRYLMDAEVSQAIAGQLSKVGVKAKVEVMEWGNYSARALDQNPANRLTMFYFGTGNPILDVDDALGSWMDSKRRGLYYNDPRLDALIHKGMSTVETEPRKAVYREALAFVKEAAPWIFLFNQADIYGVNKRVSGWKPRPDEMVFLHKASVG